VVAVAVIIDLLRRAVRMVLAGVEAAEPADGRSRAGRLTVLGLSA